MKNLARFAPVAAVLGIVLFFSGCATPRAARATRVQSAAEFTVVESSTKQELTPAQLAELREAVSNYLQEQGLASNRLYYVKISFPSENPGEEEQWAIVRIGNLPSRTYTVLATYPGPDDSYPYDYYRYGYYNASYAGFSPYGYYDPFDYNYGYYTRPVPRRDHKPDERPGGKPDHPRATPAGWDNNRPDSDQARRDHPKNPTTQPPVSRDHDRDRVRPDNSNTRNWTRNRSDDGGRGADGTRDGGRDRSSGGSSASAPTYTPPPPPVRSDPPTRSEPSSSTREEKGRYSAPVNER